MTEVCSSTFRLLQQHWEVALNVQFAQNREREIETRLQNDMSHESVTPLHSFKVIQTGL